MISDEERTLTDKILDAFNEAVEQLDLKVKVWSIRKA